MKNYIILIVFMLFSYAGIAQEAQTTGVLNENKNLKAIKEATPTPSRIIKGTNDKYRNHSRWYDIVDAVNKSVGSTNTIYQNDNYNQMWSDSTILAPFSGTSGTTYSGVWVKSVAAFFDPVDPRYNSALSYAGETHISSSDAYVVDSLFIPFVYTRNQAKPSIVDTLIISVIQSNGGGSNNDLDIRFYGPTSNTAMNHGTDTLRFLHGFLDLNPSSPNQHTFIPSSPTVVVNTKIPLTAASVNDTTSNGFNFVQIPVNLNVPAGNKVAASIVYKSGDTWTPNADTIYISGSFTTPKFNNFRFVAFEEVNGGYQQYDKGVWSQASLMRNDTSGWENWHIPCYAFNNTSYEHQWFQWLVTCPTCKHVGVDDVYAAVGKVKIYPNPASEQITITFDIKDRLNDASIDIVDVNGRTVSSRKIGTLLQGATFKKDINTQGLTAGMYFVRLKTDKGMLSEKIMIE